MVKIRLEGLPHEIERVLRQIELHLVVVEESQVYANRGRSMLVRQYITVETEPIGDSESD